MSQQFCFCAVPWPLEISIVQTFVHQQESFALPHQHLHSVSPFPAEQKQASRARLQAEILLYYSRQTVDRPPHIRIPADYVHLLKLRFFQHDDSPFRSAVSSSGDISCGSSAVIPRPVIRIAPSAATVGIFILPVSAFTGTISCFGSSAAYPDLRCTLLCRTVPRSRTAYHSEDLSQWLSYHSPHSHTA